MLKLTLHPGDFIDIGADIRVVFSGGSANNIHLLVDAPKEMNIARSTAKGRNDTVAARYEPERKYPRLSAYYNSYCSLVFCFSNYDTTINLFQCGNGFPQKNKHTEVKLW